MRNFSLVSDMRSSGAKFEKQSKHGETFAPFIALATLRAVSLQLNGMLMMWKIQQAMQDNAIQTTRIHLAFIPVTRLKCSYGKIELGQPALSYEHIKYFTKDFKSNRGMARSREPGQPSQPGLCKEALSLVSAYMTSFYKRSKIAALIRL